MSLNKSEQSLHIEPRKSPQLAVILLGIHGAAMGVLLSLQTNPWLQLALAGSIIGLLVGSWQIYVAGKSKKSIKFMVWHEDGKWSLMTEDQKLIEADLLPSSYAFPKFIVLQFLSEHRKKYSTIILSDSLSPTIFHKLFFRLRFDTRKNK